MRSSLSWSREQLILAFDLYCRTPFGKLHSNNPKIMELAKTIGRTPGALAMKLVNFASLDPIQKARGIKGLKNVSRADREVWSTYTGQWSDFVHDVSRIRSSLNIPILEEGSRNDLRGQRKTESLAVRKVRLVQSFFRATVLSGYDFRCAVCRLELPELLFASHIVPWSIDIGRRADPTNGISLCAFHDRAFDRGLMSLDDSLQVILSKQATKKSASGLVRVGLHDVRGVTIQLPDRFSPDGAALAYHREHIFLG